MNAFLKQASGQQVEHFTAPKMTLGIYVQATESCQKSAFTIVGI